MINDGEKGKTQSEVGQDQEENFKRYEEEMRL